MDHPAEDSDQTADRRCAAHNFYFQQFANRSHCSEHWSATSVLAENKCNTNAVCVELGCSAQLLSDPIANQEELGSAMTSECGHEHSDQRQGAGMKPVWEVRPGAA